MKNDTTLVSMQLVGSEMLPCLLTSAHNILLFVNALVRPVFNSALNKEQQSHYHGSVKTAVKDVSSSGKTYA